MNEYHGVIVDVSQKDKRIFETLNILGNKKDGSWILYKIGVSERDIDRTIKCLQENMVDGFYFHFYKDDKLIVIFKKKIFKIIVDKSSWKKAINYGKSIGIPEEQLDFYPCRVGDEEY